MRQPTDAIVAVTLNCNARCVMCDIWKGRSEGEMVPEDYRQLPSSLKDINLSGGEPFLRKDLPQLLRVIQETCPEARLVISTNGFLPQRIQESMDGILPVAPRVAVRVSIDGMGERQDALRGVARGYEKNLEALQILREMGVRDLGIAMTLMEANIDQLEGLYSMANELGLEFSITAVSDSDIFFGRHKAPLRPRVGEELSRAMKKLIAREYRHWSPKRLMRAWFEKGLYDFLRGKGRPLPCEAGRGFFYLDPHGNVHACHLLFTQMGNLREGSFEEIWWSAKAEEVRSQIRGCQRCWMICTAKSGMRRHFPKIAGKVLAGKIRAQLEGVQR